MAKRKKGLTPQDYCTEFDVQHNGEYAILYKAVNGDLSSWFDSGVRYEVGKTYFEPRCDKCPRHYEGPGFYLTHFSAAANFYLPHKKILECLVPLSKMVIPVQNFSGVRMSGDARTPEFTVLRVVPKEEYRKFLIMR